MYRITSRNLDVQIEGETKEEAIRNFFKLLKVLWYEWRHKLGQIAIVHENGKEYPFRIVPSLYNLGLLDENTAIYNILMMIGQKPTPMNIQKAKLFLKRVAKEDEWMVM